MAEQKVSLEGTIPVSAGSSAPLATFGAMNPAYTGVYVFSIADVSGVLAATNHLSLFNPVGSGKTLIFGGVFLSSFTVAAIALPVNSMRGFRVTTASAGTLQASSAIAEFQSSSPAPVAEVRTGNPTVTLGPALFASPALPSTLMSSPVHSVLAPPGAGAFTMVPGEGIVLSTAAGDVDQRWNISVVWAEV